MVVPRRASSPRALVALFAANLLPLAGVVWWEWSGFEVLLLYWLESGVVGALNVPKILLAAGGDASEGSGDGSEGTDAESTWEWRIEGLPTGRIDPRSDRADNAAVAGFFVVHYGIFWVVHGAFVFALPLFALAGPGGGVGTSPLGGPVGSLGWGWASPTTFLLAVGSFVVSHGVSFVTNYLRGGEYLTVSPDEQMMRPYGRVMVLHLTIVFGAFLVASLGSPLPALVLLVALKTALDLGAHLRDHRRIGRPTRVG
ncbi:DUF6498-containing protein [Halorussus limi]|uniref:DUF6498-containing protein n=1 Tax=Halorussus limi TaxID=2938695 RepID=A0A8U0HQN3_9EURY|nr:DUF6498-containing protein [Halorussus limi]UPV73250.1 DUF6498-containing protein [Halorussus limi]